jgi:hypothetical protein
MKSFVLALAAMVLIAFGASSVLNSGGFGKAADEAYTTQGARIDRTL